MNILALILRHTASASALLDRNAARQARLHETTFRSAGRGAGTQLGKHPATTARLENSVLPQYCEGKNSVSAKNGDKLQELD